MFVEYIVGESELEKPSSNSHGCQLARFASLELSRIFITIK